MNLTDELLEEFLHKNNDQIGKLEYDSINHTQDLKHYWIIGLVLSEYSTNNGTEQVNLILRVERDFDADEHLHFSYRLQKNNHKDGATGEHMYVVGKSTTSDGALKWFSENYKSFKVDKSKIKLADLFFKQTIPLI